MSTLTTIVGVALAGSMTLGCAESEPDTREIEKLSAEKSALAAEVKQSRDTVERLEAEVRTLLAENAELKNQAEMMSLELESAKRQRPVEFVERVVERPSSPPSEVSAPAQGSPINPIDDETGLQVVSASGRATERNNSWWRFAWVVTIANHSSEVRDFKLQVQFMDADGYVIDDDTAYSLTVPPLQTKTFRDSDLVDASVARKVTSINPVIKN